MYDQKLTCTEPNLSIEDIFRLVTLTDGTNHALKITMTDVVFEDESLALFAHMASLGTEPTEPRKIIYNTLISELKTAGYWDVLDFLYIWAAHSKTAALIDIKNPGVRTAVIVNDHAASFTTDRYFTGKSTSSFRIRLGFNPGDGGTYNYTQTGGVFALYINSRDTTNTGVDLSGGSAANAENQIIMFGMTDAARVTMNREQSSGENFNQMYGWHQGKITSPGTTSFYYKNGVKKDENSPTGTNAAPYNNEWFEFCSHNDAAVSLFSNRNHSGSYAGGPSIDHGTISGIIDKYLIAVGAIPSKQLLIHGNSFTAANTYPNRVLSNYSASNQIQDNIRGKAGYDILQLTADFPLNVQSAIRSHYNAQVFIFWELINSMIDYSSNPVPTYADLVAYCDMVKAAGARNLLVCTMLPANGITPSLRQNPLNLLDDSTLNGKIRNHLVQDGHADGIIDVASDGLRGVGTDAGMGIDSGGVAGVGERNTTYYGGDFIHPNTTGYQYIADTWIYPAVQPYFI